ncbi:outer membrane autotransporter barrel domain-containing protein [Amphritea atlantica]|uniref:Outer membrane autotransporter barrel domain-containing protein n=1 Tax=Amphritea atlantica TaxID=355243 RepID=A0A1H9G039_9GAMM|nr:autotransporter outer membrane beta-barrel domain-containing protein [Amphritea atlantica]SEQ43506.1 outer membrane autotransporter barrel domain-containing protein [Amphritea atlantica]
MWLQQTARTPFKRLKLGASIAATLLSGYGSRQAFAGSCLPGGSANTYICNGAENNATDVTQTLNSGANPLTVTTSAGFGIDTTSTGGNAIDLRNSSGSSISFADTNGSVITGRNYGINTRNNGTGATTITVSGEVSGENRNGVNAYNGSTTTDLTINTSTVTGYNGGIVANNLGTGATSITSSQEVNSTANYFGTGIGISATNSTTATDLTVTAARVTGYWQGISVYNAGTGATSITSTDTVTGGISAGNVSRASDLNIKTMVVTGRNSGISAFHEGSGAITITTTGTVTGVTDYGINARSENRSSELIINTVAVTGGFTGIKSTNNGLGSTSISSTGTVTGLDYSGIDAENFGQSTHLTIKTSDVIGQIDGIFTRNNGTGKTNITTTGTVKGLHRCGIVAGNRYSASDIVISAVDISGPERAIVTNNSGTGETRITSTGNVVGGISASNYVTSTDISITAATVTDHDLSPNHLNRGIITVSNRGTGETSITTGNVSVTQSGIFGIGIKANNYGTATDLTINSATITSDYRAIAARNYGTGATNITTSRDVSGQIYAKNYFTATQLTISTAAVTSHYGGVSANNYGKGPTYITSTGTVTGGAQSTGISAINLGTDLTINSVAVTGGKSGISARNLYDTGTTSITVSGTVTGGSGAGIDNYNTHNSSITLNTGSSVSAASGIAIEDGPGDTTVTINTGASATGSIRSTGGSNKIILDGGTLNVATGLALAVDGDVFNHGVINLQNSSVDAGATVNGNFTGGGDLLIDTDLATDAADTLAITGNVLAGGTQVRVNDISTGPATGNDITLISVDGTTKAGDFTLATPLVNGAFNYNALSLMGNDWVLQSVGTAGGHAYTPFASGVEALGQSLLTLEALPSLADRTRNRITGANSGDDTAIDTPVWLRIASGKRSIDGTDSTTGANFDTNHWRAQIGVDFTLSDTAASRFVAGVNAGYGQANTDVSSSTGNSKLETENYNLGVSGTWTFINGAYVDLQAQKSWYTTDLSASGAGKVNDISAEGYSASIEAGHKIPLSESLQVTPQAQLIYAKVDSDNFTGANSELVKLSDSNSLKARIGAELAKQFTDDGASQGFILANVIHEFEDETQVNVSGAQLTNSVDDWSAELGAGIRHSWNKGSTRYQLFASVTGGSSLENQGDSHSVEGEFGFKVHF